MAVPATRLKSTEVVLAAGLAGCSTDELKKALADCEHLHELAVSQVRSMYEQACQIHVEMWGVPFDPSRHPEWVGARDTDEYESAITIASRCAKIERTLSKLTK